MLMTVGSQSLPLSAEQCAGRARDGIQSTVCHSKVIFGLETRRYACEQAVADFLDHLYSEHALSNTCSAIFRVLIRGMFKVTNEADVICFLTKVMLRTSVLFQNSSTR